MRSAVAILLLVAASLAGCSSGGADGGDGVTPGPSGASDDSHDAAPNGGGDDKSNHAPSARLSMASIKDSASEFAFTLDGKDADGDALSWSLSFGDETPNLSGSALPSQVNHTFQPGNFTVRLTVNDGKEATNVTVAVSVGTPAPVQTVDGTFTVGTEGCAAAAYDQAGADPGAGAGGTTNGLTRVQFAVEPLSFGLAYTAAFTFDTGYLYVSVDFYGAGGALLSSDNTGQSPAFGGLTIDGTVPQDAVTAVLFACGGPASAKVHYEAR